MRNHQSGRWLAAVAGLLMFVSYARVCSAGPSPSDGTIAGLIAAGLLVPVLPSDAGAVISADGSPRFALEWSWQIPVSDSSFENLRHRLVPSVGLVIGDGGPSWRGRLGYRYGREHFFAGAGMGLDAAGLSFSPEIGVRFAHFMDGEGRRSGLDPALHLLARADVAVESGRVQGGTLFLGWNLY
jgi:hypothetical protein